MQRKIILFFIFFFSFFSQTIKAFEADTSYNSLSSQGIFVNVLKLGLGDVDIEYENTLLKNKPYLSICGSLGYKFHQFDENFQGLYANSWADFWSYLWSRSFYCSISAKNYDRLSSRRRTPYIEYALFFRDNTFDKTLMHYGKMHDDGIDYVDKVQSANQKMFGVNIILGSRNGYLSQHKMHFGNSFFVGFGVGLRYVNKFTYEEWDYASGHYLERYQYFSDPVHEKYVRPWVSFQAGIRIGLEMKK
jgi:hypothetical protein